MQRIIDRLGPALASLVAVWVLALGPPPSHGTAIATYHSAEHGYRLDLPAGWRVIPDEVVHQLLGTVVDPAAAQVDYDAAFQAARSRAFFDYPYAVVQILPYGSFGQPGQIPEDELDDFVAGLAGLPVHRLATARPADDAQDLGSSAVGALWLDEASRRFFWVRQSTGPGAEPIRSMTVGHFGRRAVVQVVFTARQDEWQQYAAARQQLIDSFRFDPTHAYASAAELWLSWAGEAWIGPIGGAVGLLILIVTLLVSRSSRR